MLTNFFSLNVTQSAWKRHESEEEFKKGLQYGKDLRNALYVPDEFGNKEARSVFKIEGISFTNFSFKSTVFYKISFISCTFNESLFMGVRFHDCEFFNCTFTDCNFHKAKFLRCLVDPRQFANVQSSHRWSYSNVAVHLFDQLSLNAEAAYRKDHARTANYHFSRWNTFLAKQKHKTKRPYAISWRDYAMTYAFGKAYQWTFGYGYRLRNFITTFVLVYSVCFLANALMWDKYNLRPKDVSIEAFHQDSLSLVANVFYTADATTKLVDSQLQPTSTLGMALLTVQSVFAFVLLSALVTILVNRFIR